MKQLSVCFALYLVSHFFGSKSLGFEPDHYLLDALAKSSHSSVAYLNVINRTFGREMGTYWTGSENLNFDALVTYLFQVERDEVARLPKRRLVQLLERTSHRVQLVLLENCERSGNYELADAIYLASLRSAEMRSRKNKHLGIDGRHKKINTMGKKLGLREGAEELGKELFGGRIYSWPDLYYFRYRGVPSGSEKQSLAFFDYGRSTITPLLEDKIDRFYGKEMGSEWRGEYLGAFDKTVSKNLILLENMAPETVVAIFQRVSERAQAEIIKKYKEDFASLRYKEDAVRFEALLRIGQAVRLAKEIETAKAIDFRNALNNGNRFLPGASASFILSFVISRVLGADVNASLMTGSVVGILLGSRTSKLIDNALEARSQRRLNRLEAEFAGIAVKIGRSGLTELASSALDRYFESAPEDPYQIREGVQRSLRKSLQIHSGSCAGMFSY